MKFTELRKDYLRAPEKLVLHFFVPLPLPLPFPFPFPSPSPSPSLPLPLPLSLSLLLPLTPPEIFGREHNRRPGWMTMGNQLPGFHLVDPEIDKEGVEKDLKEQGFI
jgi:hypothetical protein